jgi:hypothetical protein
MTREEILAAIREGIVEIDALIVMDARIRALEEKFLPREVVEQNERVFIATVKGIVQKLKGLDGEWKTPGRVQ